ncbi:hypothetical protein CAEBREN_03837 [Caenorhabditis brenneri]|uniref:Protein kinase domain-containing protein n=1 Tax=Caenorhabditis brenneri TaxID=135651 RepID=G0NAH3_CAEBE|nr:hypothetical protein CAEBREN_03837 [Caenorhabditis brenneri]
MKELIFISLTSVLIVCVYTYPSSQNSEALNEHRRIKRSSLADLLKDETIRWRVFIFLILYGLFVILSAVVFILFKRYKAIQRENRNNRASSESTARFIRPQERISFISLTGSEGDIDEILDRPVIRNNQVSDPVPECPNELKSLPIHERMNYIPYDQDMEIDKKNLRKMKYLGAGCFGSVYLGSLKKSASNWEDEGVPTLKVAIKNSLHSQIPSEEILIGEELRLMCQIKKHPNVLALVGAVTPSFSNMRQTFIVTEFVDCGDLLQFLQNRRDIFFNNLSDSENGYMKPKSARKRVFFKREEHIPIIEDSLDSLCTYDLLSFAYQIASGMEYLTRVPKFTEKSDVWSFGVCLYEIFSLGDIPYKSVTGDLIKYLNDGNRLEKPEYCHKDVYNFMTLCWSIDPLKRPRFLKCMRFFEEHLGESAYELLETVDRKLGIEAENQRKLEEWTKKAEASNQEFLL